MGNLSYNGKPTGVIYGFLNKILKLAKKFNTTNFIFCWDAGVTHKHNDYKLYKADRHNDMTLTQHEERKDMLIQSMELQQHTLPEMGFHNIYIQHLYEADDLIAHWVLRTKFSQDVVVVTGDSDMYQLLDWCRIYNPAQKKIITKRTFEDRFKIPPNKWALAKAIGGCSGDNVKGIEGVSDPKHPASKALKYLRDEITTGKVYQRITSAKGRAIIKRNLPLVTIPYKPDLMQRMIPRRNNYTRKKFLKTFDDYHFISFLERDNFADWKTIFLGG